MHSHLQPFCNVSVYGFLPVKGRLGNIFHDEFGKIQDYAAKQ